MADLMRWQDRNPAGKLIRNLRDSLDQLPLGHRFNEALDVIEDAVIDRLRDRLELAALPLTRESSTVGPARPAPELRARALLADLVSRANQQSEEDARQYLYCLILDQLVPDEARILAALSDGAAHAMIHVAGGPPIGPVTRRVLNYYSYVGRSASVRLEDMVPQYLGHMLRLGLVESGPEDKSLEVKYEVMSHDKTIRALSKRIEKDHRFPARILRRTIQATELGRHLWHECAPKDMTVEPAI